MSSNASLSDCSPLPHPRISCHDVSIDPDVSAFGDEGGSGMYVLDEVGLVGACCVQRRGLGGLLAAATNRHAGTAEECGQDAHSKLLDVKSASTTSQLVSVVAVMFRSASRRPYSRSGETDVVGADFGAEQVVVLNHLDG